MKNELILNPTRIDWKLLAEQKAALVAAFEQETKVEPQILEGLINFLDYLQDEAEDQEIIDQN